MADTLSPVERSQRMKLVRGKNTKPELTVRRLVHAMGYRYALHRRDLPGSPDLVFAPRKKVIFVHGCFWHRHGNPTCHFSRLPKSRLEFWLPKLESNQIRDDKNKRALRALGWKILVVWECQLGNKEHLKNRIVQFLEFGDARG